MDYLPKDREHLVTDNLNLVHYILKTRFHMYPYYNEYEDCFQEGCIGLILSAIRFDESKGFKFSTYAASMIYGQIQRYKRDKNNIVKIPRDKYNIFMNLVRYTSQGYTMNDILDITNYSPSEVHQVLTFIHMDSLDKTMVNDKDQGESEVYEVIPDNRNDYEEMLSEESIIQSINKISEGIQNQTHKNIWEEYIWSLCFGEKLNQQYFARKYGLSQAQVSRLLSNYKKQFAKILVN